MPAASLPAPASVRPQAPSTSPRTRRGRNCAFWRSSPNVAMCEAHRPLCAATDSAIAGQTRASSSMQMQYSTDDMPAPPNSSANWMPVSPRPASFGSRSMGKCCASSHAITCGRISASANSRTVRRRSCCSSVGRKSTNRMYQGQEENGIRRIVSRSRALMRRSPDHSGLSRLCAISRYAGVMRSRWLSRSRVPPSRSCCRAPGRLSRRHRVFRHEPDALRSHGEGIRDRHGPGHRRLRVRVREHERRSAGGRAAAADLHVQRPPADADPDRADAVLRDGRRRASIGKRSTGGVGDERRDQRRVAG